MKPNSSWLLVLFAGVVTLVVGFQALAGIVTFTNRSAWLDAVGQPDFFVGPDGYNTEGSFATRALLFNAYNISGDVFFPAFSLSVEGPVIRGDVNLVRTEPLLFGDELPHIFLYADSSVTPVITFLEPLRAFGADFAHIEGGTVKFSFVPLSQTGDDVFGEETTLEGDGFFGWITTPDLAFDELSVRASSATTFTMDNVVGSQDVNPVPEPTSLALLVTGALAVSGFGCWRWRRREQEAAEASAGGDRSPGPE